MKLALFFILALLLIRPVSARPSQQLVVLSDIHFNPLADPALAAQLMAAEPAQWEAIFAGDAQLADQQYGEDTNWRLFSALVSGVQNLTPKPRLIIVTGDILAHKIQEKFAAAAHSSDAAFLRQFTLKTVAFIKLELAKAGGGIPVIYTLGNNDEDCGDYALTPNGTFLRDTAPLIQTLAQADSAAMGRWSTLGSYVTKNPLAPHHRIVALNSNFWSRRYVNSCGDSSTDPGADELRWLSEQLEDARKQGYKVWLAYHIPPGVDGHSSSKNNQTVTFWKPTYAEQFNQLLDEYRNTIELNLAGHTHLDDIRLVQTRHTTTLVLINPGVSPNVGQNPAFRIFTVDAKARIQDMTTEYMPDLKSMRWQPEYSARPAYGLKRIDAQSYARLYQRMGDSASVLDQWKLYYSVSRPDGLPVNKNYLWSLYCATGHTSAEEFQNCVAAQPH